jgi:hypothetical protein
MLVKIKETTERTLELGLPAFFKQQSDFRPTHVAVLAEEQLLKLDSAFMLVVNSPAYVQEEVATLLNTDKYLPISEDEFLSAYNKAREYIAEQLFPIAK